jgi:XTP/dITP diphosphohydrolase
VQNLLIASTNAGKLKEFRDMMTDLAVNWVSLADVGLAGMDVEETGTTFTENALLKARAYAAASGLPTLADDSGLVVDALDGAPGVYSARYAPTTEERNIKLLSAMKDIPKDQRAARFVSVIALVTPNDVTITAEGRVEGNIGYETRGSHGFGYDPIFVIDDGRHLAELLPEEKHAISHRGRAMQKLHPLLRCLFG